MPLMLLLQVCLNICCFFFSAIHGISRTTASVTRRKTSVTLVRSTICAGNTPSVLRKLVARAFVRMVLFLSKKGVEEVSTRDIAIDLFNNKRSKNHRIGQIQTQNITPDGDSATKVIPR